MNNKKASDLKKVIFVGAFKAAGVDGTVGGITFACRTLLQSDASNQYQWLLIDSTASTNKQRSLPRRAFPAMLRILKLVWFLCTNRCHKVVLFAAHGLSFYEKGLMALVSSVFNVSVVFAPTSGFLTQELSDSQTKSRFAKSVFNRCESVVCQSEYWKQFYSDYCDDNSKLKVVQNWIDTDQYPVPNTANKFPVITVLYLSWVVKEKGVFELLSAVELLKDKNLPKFELIICGDGDELTAAKQLVQEHGLNHVQFNGWTIGEEKARLLRGSHIYVLPSYAEGLSNSLLEAMVSGLAVISTDVGAAVDVVQHGENGFLVAPKSVDQLSTSLSALLESEALRLKFGAQARRSVLTNNAMSVGVERFMALLD